VEVATTESYPCWRPGQGHGEAILRKFRWTKCGCSGQAHPPVACALTGVSAAIELQRVDIEAEYWRVLECPHRAYWDWAPMRGIRKPL